MQTANQLEATNLELLDALYDPAIVFSDPVGEIHGLTEMKRYFRRVYEGVIEIRFDFHDLTAGPGAASLEWTMSFRHRAIASGRALKVRGCSNLRFGTLITAHHDYFDLGEMLYERIPVLGWGVRTVKRHLGGSAHA